MTTTDPVTQPMAAPAPTSDEEIIASIGSYEYGWHDSDEAGAPSAPVPVEDVA